jgi:sarcosine oxidase gamma subunit
MRERNWSAARSPEGLLIDRPRLAARAVAGRGQTLISGDLDAALGALAPGAPLLGLYARTPEGAHALRIARDRALLISPAPLDVGDGWQGDGEFGWCATAVDDGWAVVDVEGPDAPLVLMQGTAADLSANSPSAALRFMGLTCLLARTQSGFRLHVERPWLEALLSWLDEA